MLAFGVDLGAAGMRAADVREKILADLIPVIDVLITGPIFFRS